MIEVIIVCEGRTEETFVNTVLLPHLATQDIFIQPRLISTSKHSKGGALDAQRVLRYFRNTLRERHDVYVTTFFDLYGLPPDFPGLSEAIRKTDPIDRARTVEAGLYSRVIQMVSGSRKRFFPYIQPYEFESLLFSDVAQFAEARPAWKRFISRLEAVRQSVASPEHINDGKDTHPSARLEILRPIYKKVNDGQAVSSRIGLHRIRAECLHFHHWLGHLESLSPLMQAE